MCMPYNAYIVTLCICLRPELLGGCSCRSSALAFRRREQSQGYCAGLTIVDLRSGYCEGAALTGLLMATRMA